MQQIPESQLRDASSQELAKFFDDLFIETASNVAEAEQWPIKLQAKGVTVRQKPKFGNDQQHKILQRSSRHSDVTYDQLREVLFVDHTFNETKYIPMLTEVKEVVGFSSSHEGSAGIYWLGFKTLLASNREFVELVATTERKDEDSGLREFMVVSKPIQTNTAPTRNYTRGCYEAWECVRETPDGEVEWVCIQRSDPGGWIPKCLSDWVITKEFYKDVQCVMEYISRNSSSTIKSTNKK